MILGVAAPRKSAAGWRKEKMAALFRDTATVQGFKVRIVPKILSLICLLLQANQAAGSSPANWPQFRGPNSQGVADGERPPVEFGPDKALLWKTPLTAGVSSPCIWGDRIFVTAFDEAGKKLETICLDRKTGKVVWRKDAPPHEIEKVHETSSPANTSPATDGMRVFVHFPKYGLVAYSMEGSVAWSKTLPAAKIDFGAGASPAVLGEMLVVRVQDEAGPYMLAVHCKDGETVWKAADAVYAYGWATPMTWRENGRAVIGVRSFGQFNVLDAQSGTNVWWLSGLPMSSCATPAVGAGVIFLTGTGVMGNRENVVRPPDFDELIAKHDANKDGRLGTDELPTTLLFINRGITSGAGSLELAAFLRGGPNEKSFDKAEWIKATTELFQEFNTAEFMKTAAFAVRMGGHGDATNRMVWSEARGVPEVPSPLLYRNRVYYIKNGGIFTCRDPETGKSLYDERVGAEGGYFASPVAADGRIYIASDRGVITVLQAGDAFTVLSRAELKETIMATPAIVEDKLYVRSAGHFWAFGR
jgi:outer membrane protein assembly factor BamB